MSITREQALTRAVVVSAPDLRKLHEAVSAFDSRVKYSAECRDDLTRHYDDVEKLLAFENTPQRAVRALKIQAGHRTVLALEDSILGSVRISIDGDDEKVEALSTAIDERLTGMRPWFARLAETNVIVVFSVLAAGILVGGLLVSFLTGTMPANAVVDARSQAIAYLLALAYVALGGLVYILRARLFPRVVFAIGQGERRHATLEKVRWAVIVGCGVPVALSVVGWIIARFTTGP